MAWHRPGYKPLSEPMMVCLLTHICVTRPQWVNHQSLQHNDRASSKSSLHLGGTIYWCCFMILINNEKKKKNVYVLMDMIQNLWHHSTFTYDMMANEEAMDEKFSHHENEWCPSQNHKHHQFIISHEIMSDKLWQKICMYVVKDIFVIMGPSTHQLMDRTPVRGSPN